MSDTDNASDRIDPQWGKRLQQVRNRSGLSQGDFAARLGLSKRSYVFWEMGDREPPFRLLIALRRAFRIDPVWLLEGPGDTPVEYTRELDGEILQRTLDLVDAAIHEADLRATKAQRFNLVAKAYPFVAEQPERARELLRSALDLAKETR